MNDLTKTPNQILFDLIKEANPTTAVVPADYSLGVPAVETGAKNTSVVATATAGRLYDGSQTFYYDRVDLDEPGQYFASLGPVPKTDEINSILALVTQFNLLANVNLTVDDYEATPFPTFTNVPDEEHTVTLTAKPGSLVWIGSTEITIKLLRVALSDALPNNTLNGLTYTPPA